jgi:hypothetical protein
VQRAPGLGTLSGVTDIDAIAALLEEVSETHHRVYRITDGDDPDWASWYADWLIRLSELPGLLGTPPVRSELVYEFVRLDKEYVARAPSEAWPRYYAEQLAANLSG